MKMTTWARVKCTLIVLSAFVALTATVGSSGAGCAVGCKPAYAPISAKADTEPTRIEVPTKRPAFQSLKMSIDKVGTIPGRGTMVIGTIQEGAIETGASVVIVAPGTKQRISSVATALQVSGKLVDRAEAGDTVSVLLRGVKREEVARGHLLQAP
jgi:translation elongation factor EF-Tu-like GTPase